MIYKEIEWLGDLCTKMREVVNAIFYVRRRAIGPPSLSPPAHHSHESRISASTICPLHCSIEGITL